jgi:hypothetical protein
LSDFWSDDVVYPKGRALDLLCVLEDTREDLEDRPVWTTLVVAVSGQESVLLDKLAP